MRRDRKMKQSDSRELRQAMTMFIGISMNMIIPIVLMTFVGVYFGKKFNLKWLPIPLFFVGVLAGGNNVYKEFKKFFKNDN
ncbi:AtpZ/AtpI family protein [Lachnobacterium bovis]|uniref:AtpZ/AtpI family protein n=1 Tax=Lachnobacterium bovis TaxID=140626 RepID=UPI000687BB9B|nr:AtpZ/AtpI family protein [Lachnobacterium bovis]